MFDSLDTPARSNLVLLFAPRVPLPFRRGISKSLLFSFRDWHAFYILLGQRGCLIVGVSLPFAASTGADKCPTFGRTNFFGPPPFLEFGMTNPRSFAEVSKTKWATASALMLGKRFFYYKIFVYSCTPYTMENNNLPISRLEYQPARTSLG